MRRDTRYVNMTACVEQRLAASLTSRLKGPLSVVHLQRLRQTSFFLLQIVTHSRWSRGPPTL